MDVSCFCKKIKIQNINHSEIKQKHSAKYNFYHAKDSYLYFHCIREDLGCLRVDLVIISPFEWRKATLECKTLKYTNSKPFKRCCF